MKTIKYILLVYGIVLVGVAVYGCKRKEDTVVQEYLIPITSYKKGFNNKAMHWADLQINTERSKRKVFTYSCKALQDSNIVLTLHDSTVYYNGQRLKLVDRKKIKITQMTIDTKKYLNQTTSVGTDLSYIYINDEMGLILTHNLVYDNIVEYNTKVLTEIHNKILTDSLLFIESPFIIKLKREVIELNKSITQ